MSQTRKKVVFFDFDGTITSSDTFFGVIYQFNSFINLLLKGPIAFMYFLFYKTGLLDTDKAKEQIFSLFFKNLSITDFNEECLIFSNEIENQLTPGFKERYEYFAHNDYEIVIVSASVSNWITPWASKNGINKVVATEIEVNQNGLITGRFKSENCVGIEKVNRIKALYPDRESYYFIAFGDSNGDKEMLAFADESYLNYKQVK